MRNKYLATVYFTFLHHLTSRDQYYPKYHNKYLRNNSLTKTCQPLCLNDNNRDLKSCTLFVALFESFLERRPLLKHPCDEGREGVKQELGLALLWTGKMGFTHWDWDLATGNGMNNYKMGMGFLFFSGLCSNILKQKNKISCNRPCTPQQRP